MKRTTIAIVNGPNLNLTGQREPHIYGTISMEDMVSHLTEEYPAVNFEYYQSNHEGDIIDHLQQLAQRSETPCGIVLNAGAYTHTSLAIADAIRAIRPIPVVEVHLSNIAAREEAIRHTSLIAPACVGVIAGFGISVYSLAVKALLS